MIQKSNSMVTVDLSVLSSNIEVLSGHIKEGARIMAVVKADAYGHGAIAVANHIESQVAAFAVNNIEEGIELRENGIAKPILVFAVPEESFASQYRVHNLTATISAKEHFELLPNGTSYHLNFDTGMGRLGFQPEEAERVAELVDENSELFLTGIYSHFATADDPSSDQVLRQQNQFEEIRSSFPDNLTTHIANTAATTFYDTDHFNMVRLGIGIYGYGPGDTEIERIRPAMNWKSRLVQVNTIRANHPVSYGARWEAPKDGYLGIIPVGYDDGVKRNLSGKLAVRINGTVYNVVGTITMNYCMIYLGDDKYEPGEEVEILYDQNNAGDWAHSLQTIPYEILTGINPKIPREHV
jgi:alanine racemase